jgi:hypothetical protein
LDSTGIAFDDHWPTALLVYTMAFMELLRRTPKIRPVAKL